MSQLPPGVEKSVAWDINGDKKNLFSLADKVIAAEPERQWSTWVIDARSAYFVGQFLLSVYSQKATGTTVMPQTIQIANSRRVREQYLHQRAVQRRLAKPDLPIADNNVLVVSEYQASGNGLARIYEPLRRLGASSVDAAILNVDAIPLYETPPSEHPDRLYRGAPNVYEPRVYFGILKDAVGQLCVAGYAEPVEDSAKDHMLHNYVSEAFENLAAEYSALRAAA